jgi:PST family polysaccharide transporter
MAETAESTESAHGYRQILRSSALVGGASAFNVAAGVVRGKAVALLLGPAGLGLLGLYSAIAGLAQGIAAMGINGSGVRQIAAASGTGDRERIAMTAAVLRRTSLALGVAGAAALAAVSAPVAQVTFGGPGHAGAVALLSLAVLCKVVSDGQAALVQGMRRIEDLARIAAYGGLLGSACAIGLVWALGRQGIAPALVAMAAATLVVSWRYSRRAGIAVPPVRAAVVSREAGRLLKLGGAFMASGVLVLGATYVVRLILARRVGVEAAGLYQAAWTVGGLYLGLVLQAMSADFYPRLAAVVADRAECNRVVNEQARVSLLLAGPGALATLTFAPLVLTVLFSADFQAAADVLRWICVGATLQVITWPLGFVVVAEGRPALFLATEFAYTAAHLAMAWALVSAFGVRGAGAAFALSYVFHGLMLYPIVRRMTGFRWTAANARTACGFVGLVGVVFAGFHALPPLLAGAFGAAAFAAAAAYSASRLARLAGARPWPGLRRLFARLQPAVGAAR